MYFPEPHSPYYRVTVFSNYSPHNVPDGDGYWSLMAEVCESPAKPVDARAIAGATCVAALRADGLIAASTEVRQPAGTAARSTATRRPFLGRDEVLAAIRPALEAHGVYSRGRFGAWKYEVSNQDHSFMQGVELVNRLTGAGVEDTLLRPSLVNGGAYRDRPRRV